LQAADLRPDQHQPLSKRLGTPPHVPGQLAGAEMSPLSMDQERKAAEIEQGRRIAARAEEVWKRDTRAGLQRMENRFHDLKTFWGPSAEGRVLELGCGTGTWTVFLTRLTQQVTSLDISEDLLRVARAKPGL